MSTIPCKSNELLRQKIIDYAEALKANAHLLGDHGLTAEEFEQSGIFGGAIERIRGQFAATMREKREFVARVLDYMQSQGLIKAWQSAGEANRHDYAVTLLSEKTAVIEVKGCLDGNNTNIFERPAHAREFLIWSICSNPGADPRHNVWSGIHTRLSTEIIARQQLVDGVVVWDKLCGTLARPCPKLQSREDAFTQIGTIRLPPPCIYLFPATIPHPKHNPAPKAQSLSDVEFLQALHHCFKGHQSEIAYVDIDVAYDNNQQVRTCCIRRNGRVQRRSKPTALRRSWPFLRLGIQAATAPPNAHLC